jgi:hypothetical protein
MYHEAVEHGTSNSANSAVLVNPGISVCDGLPCKENGLGELARPLFVLGNRDEERD